MKKNLPKVLAVVLLLALAVLMIFAGNDSLKNILTDNYATPQTSGSGDGANAAEAETPTETPVTPVETITDGSGTDISDNKEPETAVSVFPKTASVSQNFLWEQSVSADNPLSVEAVHQTTKGVFTVISSAACKGEITSNNKGVSVVKMDLDGTLLYSVSLAVSEETSYYDSTVTSEGLTVVVGGKSKLYVFTLDYETTSKAVLELQAAYDASLFTLSDGYILLAERAENTIYLIKNAVIDKSTTLQSGEILDIMETASAYSLFVNGVNGYSVINLDKNLFGFSVTTIPEKSALKIIPVAEGGVQKYIAVETGDGGIQIVKYNSEYSLTGAERVSLGLADGANCYCNGSTLFIMLKNTEKRLYIADLKLNFSLSSSSVLNGTENVFNAENHADGYLLLTSSGGALSLVNLANDGTTHKKSLPTETENADFIRTADGGAIVFYEFDGVIKIVGLESV